MARIDVYTDEMASLSARLKKISSDIADAEKMAASVRRNLNFQVAARLGIENNLAKAEKRLRTESVRISDLSKMTVVSAEEFRNADGQMDRKAQNIIGRITAVAIGAVDSIKKFFTSLTISRHKGVNDIFLTAGGAAIGGAVTEGVKSVITGKPAETSEAVFSGNDAVNGAVGGVGIRGMKGAAGGTAGISGAISGIMGGAAAGRTGGHTSGGGRHDGMKTETSVNVESETEQISGTENIGKPYESLISFDKNQFDEITNGDYADYSILEGLKKEYCYAQTTDRCLACADFCVGSIMGKGVLNPNGKDWQGKCKYTTRIGINTPNDSCNWTPEDIRKRAYEELTSGKPVIMRVQSGSSEIGGHSVAVIGLRNGADPDHLTDADFLIMDPEGGKIKSLSERVKVKGTDTCIKPKETDKDGKIVKSGIRRVL